MLGPPYERSGLAVNTITNNESVVSSAPDNGRICNSFSLSLSLSLSIHLVNLSTMLLAILASFIVLNKQYNLDEHTYTDKTLINDTVSIDII